MESTPQTFSFEKLREMMLAGDIKRDEGLATPADVVREDNITYGPHGAWNLLDVYHPKGAKAPLPTIVSIHGGGYFYGTKEIYQFYGMQWAQKGFAFVNFNYRLAPENPYPAVIEDIAAVLRWVSQNAGQHCIDTDKLFLLGDSAGAQLTSQIAVILTNPVYRALFPQSFPALNIRAIGLNCGMYDLQKTVAEKGEGVGRAYFGESPEQFGEQLNVLDYITAAYPPAHIITCENDFLRDEAAPIGKLLTERGVENTVTVYGTKEDAETRHVFHVNLRNQCGRQCNDDQCAFFMSHLG